MEEQNDWQNLPVHDKISHKNWKARVEGYSILEKQLAKIEDAQGFNPYLEAFKRIPFDTNISAQEKALEVILKLSTLNNSIFKQISRDLLSGIVAKCLISKPKIKTLSVQILLQLIENQDVNIVIESLKSGLSAKQPKIISACLEIFSQALQAFGPKEIPFKSFVDESVKLLDHGDKSVRDAVKSLVVELYKWIKEGVKAFTKDIKPIQLKDLEQEFNNVASEKPKITRYVGDKRPAPVEDKGSEESNGGESESEQENENEEESHSIDPYDLMEPTDVVSKIPETFYSEIVEQKWQTRKEALDNLEKLLNTPKIANNDFSEILSVLKKIISTDTNINIVSLAVKCIENLATGLRKSFANQSSTFLPIILDKFKEKRGSILENSRNAIDAIFNSSNLDSVLDIILAYFKNKSPSVKEESIKYLNRILCKIGNQLQKPVTKTICIELSKVLEDNVLSVRDSAFETLALLMTIVGEKNVSIYLDSLDDIKKAKLAETFTKVSNERSTQQPVSKKETVAVKKKIPKPVASENPIEKKETKDSPPSPAKPTSSKKVSNPKRTPKQVRPQKIINFEDDQKEPTDSEVSESVAIEKCLEILGQEKLDSLSHSAWKERLLAYEEFTNFLDKFDPESSNSHKIVFKILAFKPGWKDTNFQVLKAKYNIISLMTKKYKPFSLRIVHESVPILVDKISDAKLKDQIFTTLLDLSDVSSVNYVNVRVANAFNNTKNVKNQIEIFNYLRQSIYEFGMNIDVKFFISMSKKSLDSPNPEVKKSIIAFICTLYLFIGPKIRVLLDDIKPTLLQVVDDEFEKIKGEKAPKPKRLPVESEEKEEDASEHSDEEPNHMDDYQESKLEESTPDIDMESLITRVDISDKITDELIQQLSEKNWKLRSEALDNIANIIATAKYITPNIGELPSALSLRLSDSNKNLVISTLNICKILVLAMGKQINNHKGTLIPAIFSTLTDGKVNIRAAGTSALSAWTDVTGLTVFLEGTDPPIISALRINSSTSKCEINTWLSQVLLNKKVPPKLLIPLLDPILACATDRAAETRKSVQLSIGALALHIGVELIQKHISSSDGSIQTLLKGVLETAASQISETHKSQKVVKPKELTSQKKQKSTKKAKEENVEIPIESTKQQTIAETEAPSESIKTTEPNIKTAATEKPSEVLVIFKPGSKASRFKDCTASHLPSISKEFQSYIMSQLGIYVAPSIHTDLSSTDFKKQTMAIHTLLTIIMDDSKSTEHQAVLECSDILIGFIGGRLYDANPTLLSKCLEFTDKLLTLMISNQKTLLVEEVDYILPPLVIKLGDTKENTRKICHSLVYLIIKLSPVHKILSHLITGFDSKASKVRSEAVIAICNIIQSESLQIMALSNCSKLCTEIGKLIADKDSTTRTASLNFFSILYSQVGDKVYEYTSQLDSKDKATLKERIKRLPKPDLNKTFNLLEGDKSLNATDVSNSPVSITNTSDQEGQVNQVVSEQKPPQPKFSLDKFLLELGIDINQQLPALSPDLEEFDRTYEYKPSNLLNVDQLDLSGLSIFAELQQKFTSNEVTCEYLLEIVKKFPVQFDNSSPLSTTNLLSISSCSISLLVNLHNSMKTTSLSRDLLKTSFEILNFIFYTSGFVHSIQENTLFNIFLICYTLLEEEEKEKKENLGQNPSHYLIKPLIKDLLCLISEVTPLHIIVRVFIKLAMHEPSIVSQNRNRILQYCLNIGIQRLRRPLIPTFVDVDNFLHAFNDPSFAVLYQSHDKNMSNDYIETQQYFDKFISVFILYLHFQNLDNKSIIQNLEFTHPNVHERIKSVDYKCERQTNIIPLNEAFNCIFNELNSHQDKRILFFPKICLYSVEHNVSLFRLEGFSQLKPFLRMFLRLFFHAQQCSRIDSVIKLIEYKNSKTVSEIPQSASYYMKRAKHFTDRIQSVIKKYGDQSGDHPQTTATQMQPLDETIKHIVERSSSTSKESVVNESAAPPPKKDPKNMEDLRRRFEQLKKGFKT